VKIPFLVLSLRQTAAGTAAAIAMTVAMADQVVALD